MDPFETINELKEVAGFFEVYHKTTFHCVRKTKAGNYQEVTVEILDAGPDAQQDLRYSCTARSKDGKTANGNPGPSIDIVLATLHWGDLDR